MKVAINRQAGAQSGRWQPAAAAKRGVHPGAHGVQQLASPAKLPTGLLPYGNPPFFEVLRRTRDPGPAAGGPKRGRFHPPMPHSPRYWTLCQGSQASDPRPYRHAIRRTRARAPGTAPPLTNRRELLGRPRRHQQGHPKGALASGFLGLWRSTRPRIHGDMQERTEKPLHRRTEHQFSPGLLAAAGGAPQHPQHHKVDGDGATASWGSKRAA